MTLFKRAAEARTALFTRYDQINALFEEAEQELTRHHVARPVEFQYAFDECTDNGRSSGSGTGFAIGIQKVKGKWRLCYTSYYYPNEYCEGEYSWTPIVEC